MMASRRFGRMETSLTSKIDLDGSQPDAWRYVTEVQDAGKPAATTGYR